MSRRLEKRNLHTAGCSKYWKIQRVAGKWRVTSSKTSLESQKLFQKVRRSLNFSGDNGEILKFGFYLKMQYNNEEEDEEGRRMYISKDCVVFLDMKPIRGFGGLSELHTREETSIKSAYTSSSFRLLGFFSCFRMKETELLSRGAGKTVNTKTNIIKSTPESFRTACTFCGQCQHYFTFLQLVC